MAWLFFGPAPATTNQRIKPCIPVHHGLVGPEMNPVDNISVEIAGIQRCRSFGFTIASIACPINTNASPVTAIITPGGRIHHHMPRAAAL